MTIIKSTACLRNFPYQVLPSALVQRFLEIEPKSEVKLTTLKLFECYCDLTNVDLSKPKTLRNAVLRFVGALSDQSLICSNKDTRNKYARHIIRIYNELSSETNDEKEIEWNPNLPDLYASYWRGYPVAQSKFVYWQDWVVTSRKKKKKYLPFPKVFLTHGEQFTLQLHNSIKNFFSTQASPAQTPFVLMLEFLADNKQDWPANAFSNSREIWGFFVKFREHFFLRAHSLSLDIEPQKKLWNTFLKNITSCFIESLAWAMPYRALPEAPACALDPTKSRIITKSDGTHVRTKLITDVPLHITDEQAIKLLFKDIKYDLDVVTNWATDQTNKLINARIKRDRLAIRGTPISHIAGYKHLEDIGLDNICATFAQDGYRFSRAYLDSRFGTDVYREDLAELFALPNSAQLFPFQCLLVQRHPIITPSFLQDFELYDKQGRLSGFLKTDSGYQLIGFKDRKGAPESEQKVDLTPESIYLVQELIEITKPMRDYLKNKNDDKWRYLFLSSGGVYNEPTCPTINSWNDSRLAYKSASKLLAAQFSPHTELATDDLFRFLKRISLTTIRASSAIVNFIEHKSTEKLSKQLGHKYYSPQLLSRYLPAEILNFLQSRYIRIFQTAMICTAMEGSPYLLKATSFNTITELHDFLSLYALKNIPKDLSGKEDLAQTPTNPGHAYISVSPSTLSVLLSLKSAVETALKSSKANICAKALYWTNVATHIVHEIEAGTDHLMKSHLSEAQKNIAPDQMDSLIYDLP